MDDGAAPQIGDDSFRWRRRLVTIPSAMAVAVFAFGATPLVLPALVVADTVRGRLRLPASRLWLVGLQYLLNEVVELLTAPGIWFLSIPGDLLGLGHSSRLSSRVAMWSARTLTRRAEQLLGVRLEIEGVCAVQPHQRLVVVSRHCSLLDAALPAVVLDDLVPGVARRELAGVLMAELLVDPGFDIVYQRMGSVFVDRDDGPAARRAVRSMAESLGLGGIALIFVEGRLFSERRLQARLESLREDEPQRARRLDSLHHVLPPRAGGFTELLAGAPEADVLVVDHTGLESVPSLRDLARRAPVQHPVRVRVRHFQREDVPVESAAMGEWLDDRFVEMDRWVTDQQLTPGRRPRTRPSTTTGRRARGRTRPRRECPAGPPA